MKHLLVAGLVLIMATPALANKEANRHAYVQDHYKTITKQIPHVENRCKIVEVPIYGKKEFDKEGAIIGGIVGGLLGNQVGGGSGKEAATGVGAMTGAIIGGQGKQQIVGYRQEEVCTKVTTYEQEAKTVYSHSTVKFYHDGREYNLKFQR